MESLSGKRGAVWGGLLILFGVLGLLQAVADVSEWVWVAILTLAGFGVFALYLTDRSDWSLLIPAYVMWVVAGLIAFTRLGILQDESVATYVLLSIAAPFVVVFALDRANWWALIPAYVLTAVGLMVGLIGQGILRDTLIPSYVMFAIAIPFFVVYARDPRQPWALIPAGVMSIIGLSLLFAGDAAQYVLPIALILAGLIVVARQFMRGSSTPPDVPS